jgi:hypothetical protein
MQDASHPDVAYQLNKSSPSSIAPPPRLQVDSTLVHSVPSVLVQLPVADAQEALGARDVEWQPPQRPPRAIDSLNSSQMESGIADGSPEVVLPRWV